MVAEKQSKFKWGMAIDIDKCTGCQARAGLNITSHIPRKVPQGRHTEWRRRGREDYG